jgi:ribosome-binding factor A
LIRVGSPQSTLINPYQPLSTKIMADIRQKQVAEMIKRHFSVLLQQEGGYVYGTQAFVTVTNVKMTPDFNVAKIYLSISTPKTSRKSSWKWNTIT